MNIMLVSVTERTFEVGLAKSTRRDAQTNFAAIFDRIGLLCVAGGIFGLLLAVGVTTFNHIRFGNHDDRNYRLYFVGCCSFKCYRNFRRTLSGI